jgi:hypothetical protein
LDNIVEFPRREPETVVIEFEIELDSVDQARRTLEALQATVAVGLTLCEKAETIGDGVVLAGVRRLFGAFARMLVHDRQLDAVCALPRIRKDPPPDAS